MGFSDAVSSGEESWGSPVATNIKSLEGPRYIGIVCKKGLFKWYVFSEQVHAMFDGFDAQIVWSPAIGPPLDLEPGDWVEFALEAEDMRRKSGNPRCVDIMRTTDMSASWRMPNSVYRVPQHVRSDPGTVKAGLYRDRVRGTTNGE